VNNPESRTATRQYQKSASRIRSISVPPREERRQAASWDFKGVAGDFGSVGCGRFESAIGGLLQQPADGDKSHRAGTSKREDKRETVPVPFSMNLIMARNILLHGATLTPLALLKTRVGHI
jgi:hypothetical protein